MNMPRVDAGMLPPLALPLRFFITAPLFGVLGALWLLAFPPTLWITRWHPGLLAATHLLVLGFLLMVMAGALAQVVPVLACRPLRGARHGLPVVHALLIAGTLLLALALGTGRPLLLPWSVAALVGGAGLLLGLLVHSLFRPPAGEVAVWITRLAVLALGVTVVLGAWLALAQRWPGSLPFSRSLTNLHAVWGLAGAAGLLILGVGSQVIPMFHVTPAPGATRLRGLAGGWFLLLVAALVLAVTCGDPWLSHSLWLVNLGPILFAVLVLGLLARRKRKVPDATVEAWRGAAVAVLLGCVTLVVSGVIPGKVPAAVGLSAQVVLVVGGVLGVVVGLLLKIVPFLAWLHLQTLAGFDARALGAVPHMQALLPAARARLQVRLHLVVVVILAGCPLLPVLHRPGALLLLADMGLLAVLVLQAARRYRSASRRITECLAG